MQNEQRKWIENKLVSNYRWLLEEIEKQLSELEMAGNLEEKERIIKNTEWTIGEFNKSNRNNFSNLKKMKIVNQDDKTNK